MGSPDAEQKDQTANQVKQLRWTSVPLINNDETDCSVQVSNGSVALPLGFNVVHNFVTLEESKDILEQVDKETFRWEGFEQRKRVLRFKMSDEGMPSKLSVLADRIKEKTGRLPESISVEEYPRSQLMKQFNPSIKTTVTTFESPARCKCDTNNCPCFVAIIPICAPVIENINRPKKRSVDCWDLYSPDHHTGLVLNQRSLFVKTEEVLWEWRSRISAVVPSDITTPTDDRIVLVKIYSLPEASPVGGSIGDTNFGFIAKPEDSLIPKGEMPPLEDLLTIIVTTSPIKSNPSTELLERVFQTFTHGGYDFAYKCRKIVVCDGCRQKNESVSKRHTNTKQAMRNGIVDAAQHENYIQFKKNLRELCGSAGQDSPFFSSKVEELEFRHGYGFALRHALRECITTPYVIVIQHDRTFMRPTPIHETVRAMWHHRNIKYVGMSMRSNLLYRDHFLGKYGRAYMDDMGACIQRPPELSLDAGLYGPDSRSTQAMEYGGYEALRENIRALMDTYRGSQQNTDHLEWLKSNPPQSGKCQLSLTPTFFWYDNVHICETAHYRDFIFNPTYKMVVKGGFVEDKLSPVIKKSVERLGLKEGFKRFGCFLLDDHSGMFFTGHLDGGSYLTAVEKQALSKGRKATNN